MRAYNPPQSIGRLDADDTMFFLRELESIDQRPYEVLFAAMLGRRYLPMQDGVDPTADVYTYRMYERHGSANLGGPRSNNFNTVNVTGAERSSNIRQIPVGYGWSVREIQQAAKLNKPLDQLTIRAAQAAVARRVDNMLAFTDAQAGTTGIYGSQGTPIGTASTASSKTTAQKWTDSEDPTKMLADLNTIVNDTHGRLKQAGDDAAVFPRFLLVLPSNEYAIAASTPRSANSDTTILKYAIQNNPWIESIEEWWQGETAGASSAPRFICFPRDPLCLAAIIPQEFTSLAPQPEGLNINIPAYGSCGGLAIRYTVAIGYMDIAQS
jgi:hypothetical protein